MISSQSSLLEDYMEILDHFDDISRKYLHGGRRRSVFGNHDTDSAVATDNELFAEDCKQNLFATLKCVGVICMTTGENDRILTIPFEQSALRDVIWKRYMRTSKGEAKSREFLTEYFKKKQPSLRVVEELPWHYKKSNDLAELQKLLTDLRVVDLVRFHRYHYI